MQRFRIDPLVLQVRFYDHEIDASIPLCEMDDVYSHIITISVMDNGTCRLTGNTEPIGLNRAMMFKELKERFGIIRAEWRHKGEHSFKLITQKVLTKFKALDD